MFQKSLEIAQRYFDAWTQHDADAIVATFAETGTYADPVTPGRLTGAEIGAYAQGFQLMRAAESAYVDAKARFESEAQFC